MSKPLILMSPGAFAMPDVYDQLVEKARGRGVDVRALHLPSIGLGPQQSRPGKAPSMYDDAEFIAKEAEKESDAGRNVILVAHSYSGMPVSQCTQGLTAKERHTQGKTGGVVGLAFITSLVPSLGESGGDVYGRSPNAGKANPMEPIADGWLTQPEPEKTAALCMQTIPLEDATAFIKMFANFSSYAYLDKLSYEGYKNLPVSYLFCELDQVLPPSLQQEGIDIIEKVSGNKVDVTRIQGDHCPNWTSESEVVDWLVNLSDRFTK